ncbi:NUDIX domain-containing protein [Streptomyces fuscigenes]|uniref:NUDIX domain-containing protein n=1 Tax=Streptomyces fuscigenes TaxID=1528880 RepID=UPI001F33CE12|nr:NUDIX hydrolase [Streptomyces fuscigenes]MCF3963640.1 NUDIX hydrolase [Streptomyces fuscigenes]
MQKRSGDADFPSTPGEAETEADTEAATRPATGADTAARPAPGAAVDPAAGASASADASAGAGAGGGPATGPRNEAEAELAVYLARHSSPAACADALIRDPEGRVLLVEPTYKDGWDLPGGMLEDEEPEAGMVREVREELGLEVRAGRLLVVDTVPADVHGRTILAFVYATEPVRPPADGFVLQQEEIARACFFTEQEALGLVPGELARRLAGAFAADRAGTTAALRHGRPVPQPRAGTPAGPAAAAGVGPGSPR